MASLYRSCGLNLLLGINRPLSAIFLAENVKKPSVVVYPESSTVRLMTEATAVPFFTHFPYLGPGFSLKIRWDHLLSIVPRVPAQYTYF